MQTIKAIYKGNKTIELLEDVQLAEERQKSTQEALEELKKLIEEINAARKEQERRNMTAEVFSVFWLLKKAGSKKAESQANQMKDVFEKFPHWRRSEAHEREVKQNLYGVLRKSGIKDANKVTEIAQNIMRTLKGGV